MKEAQTNRTDTALNWFCFCLSVFVMAGATGLLGLMSAMINNIPTSEFTKTQGTELAYAATKGLWLLAIAAWLAFLRPHRVKTLTLLNTIFAIAIIAFVLLALLSQLIRTFPSAP